MKLLLKLLVILGLAVYLGFAFAKFSGQGSSQKCDAVKVSIADSTHAGFITAEEVERLLHKAKLYPVGKLMDSIDNHAIEQALLKNAFIRDVECYKSAGGTFNVLVTQRLPLLRVLAENGDNYYIDANGKPMAPQHYKADLVVATGAIERKDLKSLVALGNFLYEDPFWSKQVEQIHILPNKEIEIIPRVGEQSIFIGEATNLKKKFRNLRVFYERVMPEVGWNKYSTLNIAYENQIVCTKNKK